jgi:Ca-activated chloride channel family protein
MATLSPGIGADAEPVRIEADMAQPFVLAGPAQKGYLRVTLRGLRPAHTSARPPANVAIVLDKSGSMTGQKIEHARDAAIRALSMLGPNDIVSIVTYDDTVHVLVPATKLDDRDYVYSKIGQIQAGGSTALFAGVSKGAAEVRKFLDENHVNRVILLSDGLANVGPSSPGDLAELGTSLGREGIAVTTIGLGLDYNEDLMTKLAQASDGNHTFAEAPSDLDRAFAREFGDVLSVVAQDVDIVIECANGVRPVRVLGRNANIIGQRVVTSMNQLYGDQEKYVFVEVELPKTDDSSSPEFAVATARVNYNDTLTRQAASGDARAIVQLTQSPETVEQRTNAPVMALVIEQIAVNENIRALELRDAGKLEECKEVLSSNSQFLQDNAVKYRSERLRDYAESNEFQAQSVDDEEGWKLQRKVMREEQFQKTNQVDNKSSTP